MMEQEHCHDCGKCEDNTFEFDCEYRQDLVSDMWLEIYHHFKVREE